MQGVHQQRSGALRRLLAQREKLSLRMNQQDTRPIDLRLKHRLDRIDMAIESISRSIYRTE